MLLSDAFLRQLEAYSLAMRDAARGGTGGMRRAKALGSSVEFSDFRNYAPGDDLRRVDWNAFARFDRLFLKLFLDEQETTLRVLLDASASMAQTDPEKWRLALQLSAALSYLSLSRYDRVVICVMQGETLRHSRTFGGRASYAEAEAYLEGISPAGETQLNASLLRVPVTAGRGVCVLISDLLTDTGWTHGAASLLHRRQELSVLHLLSVQEIDPDFTGALQLIDSEGGPTCDVNLSLDALRHYHKTLNTFLHDQKEFCHSHSIPYLMLRGDMPLERDVLKALMQSGVLVPR